MATNAFYCSRCGKFTRHCKISLRELATELNSTSFINRFKGTCNSEDSALHRRLNNEKSDLIKKNEL